MRACSPPLPVGMLLLELVGFEHGQLLVPGHLSAEVPPFASRSKLLGFLPSKRKYHSTGVVEREKQSSSRKLNAFFPFHACAQQTQLGDATLRCLRVQRLFSTKHTGLLRPAGCVMLRVCRCCTASRVRPTTAQNLDEFWP